MTIDLDTRLTFDTFVVGPANRLAFAAAKRAAESPGTSYNPLFLYSASGLGKSHILAAVAHHSARQRPDRVVVYRTLEGYLDELAKALEAGGQDAMRERYLKLDVLLLDDVQFLTGQAQAQEMLLRTLDALTGRGNQIVLASDRPPAEINGLDARLLSRFSGGLIVDIGPPDYETRVAIMRRKSEERGTPLAAGVAEALARYPFKNVRELQGALNRLLAVQELEGRPVMVGDLASLMGDRSEEGGSDLAEFLGGMGTSGDPDAEGAAPKPDEPRWRKEIWETVSQGEGEGFSVQRIAKLLDEQEEPEDWEETLQTFRNDLDRAREIRIELNDLGNPWPEAATTLLRDPDRLAEAESLLASARERARAFSPIAEGPSLAELEGKYPALALRAASRLMKVERPDYNPLYLYSPDPARARGILEAAGRTFIRTRPEGRAALVSVSEFAEEFIRAISYGVAGAWRERWWSVELLLLHGIEGLSGTERAQEEFFHLFEALIRRGGRILLAADRPPSRVEGVDDRLLSRFEGGLVVELGPEPGGSDLSVDGEFALAEEGPTEAEPERSEATTTTDEAPGPVQAPDSGTGYEREISLTEPETTSTPEPGLIVADAAQPNGTEDEMDDLAAVRELAGVSRGRKREEQPENGGGPRRGSAQGVGGGGLVP